MRGSTPVDFHQAGSDIEAARSCRQLPDTLLPTAINQASTISERRIEAVLVAIFGVELDGRFVVDLDGAATSPIAIYIGTWFAHRSLPCGVLDQVLSGGSTKYNGWAIGLPLIWSAAK